MNDCRIIVSFYLGEDAFCSLDELGNGLCSSKYTCLVRAELDGGFWHDLDDIQAITYYIP